MTAARSLPPDVLTEGQVATAEEFVRLPPKETAKLLQRVAEAEERDRRGLSIPAEELLARLRSRRAE